MLEILSGSSRANCRGQDRRAVLRVGSLALGGLGLGDLLRLQSRAATRDVWRGKSVVLLFLTGGPSQIETFDPKMGAPSDYRSVTGSLQTRVPGVHIGGTFEQLAPLTDRLALIRSFAHSNSDHTEAAQLVMRCGNPTGAGIGSIATRMRGISHPQTGMPTQVYLTSKETDRQFNKERLRLLEALGPGQLGGAYGPFQVGGDDQFQQAVTLRISPGRLDDRLALQRSLDRLRRRADESTLPKLEQYTQQAVDLVLGKSRAAFDLSKEDPKLIERYDTGSYVTGIHTERASTLGRQLLLARRLCESGCGFITIHNPGWDMHGGDTQLNMPHGMEMLGRPVDRAVSAFLDDIEARGLSDEILFVLTGEFGRTPKVKTDGGRDHWPHLSTLAFAGGGLKMGQVIGQSTSRAEEPRSDPVGVENLLATVLHVLFDIPRLRLTADLPRELATLIDQGEPIQQLF